MGYVIHLSEIATREKICNENKNRGNKNYKIIENGT
jgi:hypothetical protein